MSAFEIAHLKQCLKRSEARERRQDIIIQAFLHRGVTARFHHFIEFMKTIPDIMLPTHPSYLDAMKYYKEFDIFHAAWVSEDSDTTFSEFLQIKSQQHDINE